MGASEPSAAKDEARFETTRLPDRGGCPRCSSPTCIWARGAARRSLSSTCSRATRRTSIISSATSSTAGGCKEGWRWTRAPQRRRAPFPRSRPRRRARRLHPRQSRRIRARASSAGASRASRSSRTPSTSRATASAISSRTATRSTSSSSARRRSPCSATSGYRLALAINTALNAVDARLGLPYWSFSAWIKLKIKTAVNAIGDFERQLAAEARRRGVDGVICGHIHHPTMREIDGVAYINIGDFVESCSLVIEREDGAIDRAALAGARARSGAGARPAVHRGGTQKRGMKIVVATDAWGQTNGVVFAYQRIAEPVREFGAELALCHAGGISARRRCRPIPASASPSRPPPRSAGASSAQGADHVHIATEGPIGWATRRHCLQRGAAVHDQLPHPLSRICRAPALPVPLAWSYAYLRRFHAPAERVLVPTPSMKRSWSGAVSRVSRYGRAASITALFRPRERSALDLPRPIFLNVGRVAVEKNLEAFLDLDLPGSKVIVGDGPALAALRAPYPRRAFPRREIRRRSWRRYSRAPTFSCFPRAPTRSAWC